MRRRNLVGTQRKNRVENLLNKRTFSLSVEAVEESKETIGGTGGAEVRLLMYLKILLGWSMAKSCS